VTRYLATVGSRALSVELIEDDEGLAVRLDGGRPLPARVRRPRGDELHVFLVGDRVFEALVELAEGACTIVLQGEAFEVRVQDERAARLASITAGGPRVVAQTDIRAPMPGLVVAVQVEPGQTVSRGSSLVVLQAMKMENELTAHEDGRVREVLVSPGQTVDQGQALVRLE